MTIDEQIAIIKAYKDGKTIERKSYIDKSNWCALLFNEEHPFDFFSYEYRIKQEPKYRPYESVEEAFNEAKKHGFWMRNKDRGFLRFIDGFTATKNFGLYLGDYWAADNLGVFVWHDDGSPCGVKI